MRNKDINRILRKYLTGELERDDDKRYLNEWLKASSENRNVLKKLEETWAESSQEPALVTTDAKIDELWTKGAAGGNEKKNTINLSFYLKIAATVCIFLVAGFIMYRIYIKTREKPIARTEYVVKSNPSGQKTKFYLPDGSIVWLNSASSLRYVKGFKGTARSVKLSGEAYFEVAKNRKKPFIVKSGEFTTTALGTAFNVHFYPDEPNVQISLIEGKVLVDCFKDSTKSIILAPGLEVFYHKETGELLERQFNKSEVLGWKHGSLVFKEAGYEEVVRKLEKWFGVTVKTVGNLPKDWSLTTTYTDQTLVNILDNLKYSKDFNYELNENDLIIKF